MAERKCGACGLMALVRHDGYLVCEDCSTVQSEDMITSEYQDAVGYQAASENLWIMNDKQKLFTSYHHVPAGKLSGQTNIKNYGSIFYFTQVMIENADNMYNILFKDPEIIHRSIVNKNYISLGCLFLVGRKYQKTVSMKRFCKVTQIPSPKLIEALKIIRNKLSIELPTKTVIEITLEITSEHEIRPDVVGTTLKILHLCDRAWLLTGRQPQKFIWAAIYIASKSINIAELKTVSFVQFLKKYSQSTCCGTDQKRLKEVLEILTDLGEHIPWASDKGQKNFVFYNLQDIIKYSEMAMMERKRKLLKTMDEEQKDKSQETTNQKRKLDSPDTDDVDIYQPPILKYPKKSNTMDDPVVPSQVYVDCDTEHLGSEIDEELDEYIRSDKEVIQIEMARALIIDKELN